MYGSEWEWEEKERPEYGPQIDSSCQHARRFGD